jgi:D-aminopeptidase
VAPEDVWAAIDAAVGGPVEEGSVGAGTGTTNFGWKGGIGTASRVLPDALGGYTLGALVQTNYGGLLRIDGVPIGEALGQYSFRSVVEGEAADDEEGSPDSEDEGSCMIVLATDAPLSPRNLERIAKRAIMGLARTGSFMSNGTGDFVIAFSTPNRTQDGAVQSVDQLANRAMSPLFLATVEAVEEAVYNALTAATTVRGRDGHVIEALPLDRVETLLREAGRIE